MDIRRGVIDNQLNDQHFRITCLH